MGSAEKVKAYNAAYYAGNRERLCNKNAEWRSKNKDLIRKNLQKWRKRTSDTRRDKHLKDTYGISLEDWNELFQKQDEACAICRSRKTTRAWDTDHDHVTGKVRGILCRNCNLLLGLLGDDEINALNRMQVVLRYLKGL